MEVLEAKSSSTDLGLGRTTSPPRCLFQGLQPRLRLCVCLLLSIIALRLRLRLHTKSKFAFRLN